MEDFDLVQSMIDMITSLIEFLFDWLRMAASNNGRAPL